MSEAGPSQPSPQVAQTGQGKKRKRTGKEREERKQAAILAGQAEKDKPAEEVASAADNEDSADTLVVQPETEKGNDEETTAAAPEVDLDRLSKRLPTALKHLNPVFKRAKTVETARLIKKIKALKSKGKDGEAELTDLEAQRQLLAHLSVGPTVSKQLLTNLRKYRLFKRNPDLIPAKVVETLSAESTPTDEVSKKVENRLCSAKAAADEMKRAVAWLMGEEGSKLGGPTKKVPALVVTESAKSAKSSKNKTEEVEEEEDDEDDEVASRRRNMVVDSDDEDGEEEDVAADEAGWESGSVSGGDDDLAKPGVASDSEDEDAIPIAPPSKKSKPQPKEAKPKSKPKPESAPSKKLTSSTFLPSLSTGFTRGGSDDSDPDDDTGEGLEDIIGKGRTGERKNRRGQQARRLIWERKYGKNAKHVQKASAQATEGNIAKAYGNRAAVAGKPAGQAPSTTTAMATTNTTAGPKTGARPPSTFTPSARPAFTPRPTPAPPAAASTGPLHPSWEAARLRKQKEAEGPKATKIIFD